MTSPRFWCPYNGKFCRILTKALALTCVVVTYTIVVKSYVSLTSTKQLSWTSVTVSDNTYSLAKAIASRASRDRYIVLAMADESFADMAINLYEASFLRNNISNYLFVGVGNSTCEVLARQSVACFHYVNDPDAHRASRFGTLDFVRKMNIRTDIVLEALEANYTVLHTDVDIYFMSSPVNEIRVKSFSMSTKCTIFYLLPLLTFIVVEVNYIFSGM